MGKWLFRAAILIALVLVLAPQWRSIPAMGDRRIRALDDTNGAELLVGVSWPFALLADGMADGLELARDRINEEGLPDGTKLRLIERDDGDDWETARKIALEFAADPKMSAVVGYDDDSVAIRASPIFEAAKLLHICVNTNSPAMTQHNYKYILRTVQSTDKIARFLAKSMPVGRFAMVWQDDAYGKDLTYEYRVTQDARGARMVYQWPYPPGGGDFRLPVNQLKSVDVDVILFWGNDEDAVAFMRKARGVGVRAPILVATDLTNHIMENAGDAIDGTYFLTLYDSSSTSPENVDFIRRFRERFGRAPDTAAAQGYDALLLLASVVRATKSLNPLDLSFALRFMTEWRGANGTYVFSEEGELRDKPLRLTSVRVATPNGPPTLALFP